MNVLDVLKLIDNELVPIKDCRVIPDSSLEVELCFTCEDETHNICNIESAMLVPWYKCPVQAISASGDKVQIWIDGDKYLRELKLL